MPVAGRQLRYARVVFGWMGAGACMCIEAKNRDCAVTEVIRPSTRRPYVFITLQRSTVGSSLRTSRRGGECWWVAEIPIFPSVSAVSFIFTKGTAGKIFGPWKNGENGTVKKNGHVIPFCPIFVPFLSHFPPIFLPFFSHFSPTVELVPTFSILLC